LDAFSPLPESKRRITERLARTGIILVFLGVTVYGIWLLWLATRTKIPVAIPMSMAIGHVRTPEFRVNLSALFNIEIEVQKSIPFDRLNCLLGMDLLGPRSSARPLGECPDQPSVVKASWVLTSDGITVASGSTDDGPRLGSWRNDSITRQLGAFQSQSGRRYVVDVDVLADGSALRQGNPQLKVEVDSEYTKAFMVGNFLVFLGMGIIVLIGSAMLFISSRGRKSSASS
jgi:hypothetical protein